MNNIPAEPKRDMEKFIIDTKVKFLIIDSEIHNIIEQTKKLEKIEQNFLLKIRQTFHEIVDVLEKLEI